MNDKELISEATAHIDNTLAGIGTDESSVRAAWARGEGSDDRFSLLVRLRDRLAAVPDAATEVDYHEGLEEGIKIGRAERAEAERDEARESRDGWAANAMEYATARQAIERVRAINTGNNRALYGNDFEAGMAKALWLVKAALDGAPEPEVKP